MGRLSGRIALITGASRGIGAAVAAAYAREGAELILTARTVGGLEATDDAVQKISGKHALLVPFDLAKLNAIDELAAAIEQRYGRLDILLGNAGQLGMIGPLAYSDPAEFEKTLTINLTANYRLLRAFTPLLLKSTAPRALFVTSGVTQEVMPNWNAYSISKVALEHMVKLYAKEMLHTKLKAFCIDPGEVATQMHAKAMPGANPQYYAKPEEIVETFISLAESGNTLLSGARCDVVAA
jgi:NAD(P)-dependent dehydrogenase (short-subunit alcohol dehydrogenase family)